MPKILSADLAETILAELGQHPLGAGMDALHGALAGLVSRRTLQRRLAALVKEKRVFAQGEARGVKYTLALPLAPQFAQQFAPQLASRVATVLTAQEPDTVQAAGEVYVPTSPAGDDIRAYVRQPRQLRKPVSYKQSFLEQYTPNGTAYLPESLRAQLHAMGRPPVANTPAGTFARDILNRLLIDLSWASSQLEGNTYSRLDTERLIEFGQAATGKDALETQMILNHKAAIEFLVRDTEHIGINPATVVALHAFLSDGLMPDPAACGRLRHRPVEVGGSVYLPIAMPQRIEELFTIVLEMAAEIRDPFEQSFFLMVHLPYLQPFEDVNKRVSRLAANIPFVLRNLSPLSFIDVAQQDYVDGLLGVYELNRIELLRDVFVRAYERSCQQYVAVHQQLIPPDAMRLRYRHQLSQLVAAIVRADAHPDQQTIRAYLPQTVAQGDRERFIALAVEEFETLHAGNAIRFGLRPLEFSTWKERNKG